MSLPVPSSVRGVLPPNERAKYTVVQQNSQLRFSMIADSKPARHGPVSADGSGGTCRVQETRPARCPALSSEVVMRWAGSEGYVRRRESGYEEQPSAEWHGRGRPCPFSQFRLAGPHQLNQSGRDRLRCNEDLRPQERRGAHF
jgi:hypothetical protein